MKWLFNGVMITYMVFESLKAEKGVFYIYYVNVNRM